MQVIELRCVWDLASCSCSNWVWYHFFVLWYREESMFKALKETTNQFSDLSRIKCSDIDDSVDISRKLISRLYDPKGKSKRCHIDLNKLRVKLATVKDSTLVTFVVLLCFLRVWFWFRVDHCHPLMFTQSLILVQSWPLSSSYVYSEFDFGSEVTIVVLLCFLSLILVQSWPLSSSYVFSEFDFGSELNIVILLCFLRALCTIYNI